MREIANHGAQCAHGKKRAYIAQLEIWVKEGRELAAAAVLMGWGLGMRLGMELVTKIMSLRWLCPFSDLRNRSSKNPLIAKIPN